jgi:hypothetical protein
VNKGAQKSGSGRVQGGGVGEGVNEVEWVRASERTRMSKNEWERTNKSKEGRGMLSRDQEHSDIDGGWRKGMGESKRKVTEVVEAHKGEWGRASEQKLAEVAGCRRASKWEGKGEGDGQDA